MCHDYFLIRSNLWNFSYANLNRYDVSTNFFFMKYFGKDSRVKISHVWHQKTFFANMCILWSTTEVHCCSFSGAMNRNRSACYETNITCRSFLIRHIFGSKSDYLFEILPNDVTYSLEMLHFQKNPPTIWKSQLFSNEKIRINHSKCYKQLTVVLCALCRTFFQIELPSLCSIPIRIIKRKTNST